MLPPSCSWRDDVPGALTLRGAGCFPLCHCLPPPLFSSEHLPVIAEASVLQNLLSLLLWHLIFTLKAPSQPPTAPLARSECFGGIPAMEGCCTFYFIFFPGKKKNWDFVSGNPLPQQPCIQPAPAAAGLGHLPDPESSGGSPRRGLCRCPGAPWVSGCGAGWLRGSASPRFGCWVCRAMLPSC